MSHYQLHKIKIDVTPLQVSLETQPNCLTNVPDCDDYTKGEISFSVVLILKCTTVQTPWETRLEIVLMNNKANCKNAPRSIGEQRINLNFIQHRNREKALSLKLS